MPYATYVDDFSTISGNLTRKEQGDIRRVLAEVMRAKGMFSIFDATENQSIASSMTAIERSGWIKRIEHGYPWLQWELTDEGRQQLDGFAVTTGKGDIL
jgi:hypothetical protein